jgi:hypothetical protein
MRLLHGGSRPPAQCGATLARLAEIVYALAKKGGAASPGDCHELLSFLWLRGSRSDHDQETSMTSKLRSAVVLGAALALGSAVAEAAVYDASYENNVGSQTISSSLTTTDVLVISGLLDSGAGAVDNATIFTVAPGTTNIDLAAVWRSGEPGDTLRLISVNIDLLDSSDTVLASDTFTGTLDGFAHSVLSFAGLTAGEEYTIRLTGDNTNVGQYKIDATFVPLPSAFLLLGPALVGLGLTGARRRG